MGAPLDAREKRFWCVWFPMQIVGSIALWCGIVALLTWLME